MRSSRRHLGEGAHDVFEGAVEGLDKVEWLVEEAVGQLAVVCADLIQADLTRVSRRPHMETEVHEGDIL
jgi:hypothetical protein